MKTGFLKRSPFWRYVHLRRLVKLVKSRAKAFNAPFSILCYGSASYGFNPHCHGKLDDLDLFLIIPEGITFEYLMASIKQVFPEGLEANEHHIAHLLSGSCDICRLYARIRGMKVGCRLLMSDTFEKTCSDEGSVHPMRNIASFGQSRIIKDREWSFRSRRYVSILCESRRERVQNEDVLLVIQRVLSKRKARLGILGRKLLKASVIYEGPGLKAFSVLEGLWKIFVERSLRFKPGLTPDEITESIIRSEKFSKNFRSKLARIIQRVRA